MTVAAVVLAAGGGRRYGMPKALVEYEGSLLVERAVATAQAVCDTVLVVLGAQAVDVWREARLDDAILLVNEEWETGMASSLRTGLEGLRGLPGSAVDAAMITLVDMPGYGYAAAPKTKVASWTALIHRFLLGRASLARVYVLIDARHGLKDVDRDVCKTLDKAAVSYQVVLTKADQVKPAELATRIAETTAELARHPAAFPEVLATSSRTGAGMPELRAAILRLLDERGS